MARLTLLEHRHPTIPRETTAGGLRISMVGESTEGLLITGLAGIGTVREPLEVDAFTTLFLAFFWGSSLPSSVFEGALTLFTPLGAWVDITASVTALITYNSYTFTLLQFSSPAPRGLFFYLMSSKFRLWPYHVGLRFSRGIAADYFYSAYHMVGFFFFAHGHPSRFRERGERQTAGKYWPH